jgi:phenylalanyl-tRNA synthetase beta subunit
MHLDVGLYAEADCPRNDLVIIAGIQFVLPIWMRALLTGYELDYVQNRFVLTNGDRIYRRLLDLVKGESSAV